jgi:hypothetical protein
MRGGGGGDEDIVNGQRPAFQNQADELAAAAAVFKISQFRGAAGNGAQKTARAGPSRTCQNKLIDPPPFALANCVVRC